MSKRATPTDLPDPHRYQPLPVDAEIEIYGRALTGRERTARKALWYHLRFGSSHSTYCDQGKADAWFEDKYGSDLEFIREKAAGNAVPQCPPE